MKIGRKMVKVDWIWNRIRVSANKHKYKIEAALSCPREAMLLSSIPTHEPSISTSECHDTQGLCCDAWTFFHKQSLLPFGTASNTAPPRLQHEILIILFYAASSHFSWCHITPNWATKWHQLQITSMNCSKSITQSNETVKSWNEPELSRDE